MLVKGDAVDLELQLFCFVAIRINFFANSKLVALVLKIEWHFESFRQAFNLPAFFRLATDV